MIFISNEDTHFSSLKSDWSWGRWYLMSDAVPSVFAGLPGAFLAHPLWLGCLACAWWGEHWWVFNAQLYIEKPCGQYHTVIFGEGFLDRITILDGINANPSFIYKRKASWVFNVEDRQNTVCFNVVKCSILTTFKYSSVALNAVTLLWKYHHHPSSEIFHLPQLKLCAH